MIRLSKREDYAIILINELARNFKKRLVPLSKIAKDYSISVLFLRNLAHTLKKAGLIRAVEGKTGGYYLVKNPTKLKMGAVLNIFSKNQLLECCPSGQNKNHSISCSKEKYCITGNVWRQLNKEFMDKINNLSLLEFLSYKY